MSLGIYRGKKRMNEYSPAGNPAFTGTHSESGVAERLDPLAELEQRWDSLAKSVRDLRSENAALWEQLQGREDHVSRMEQELTAKTAEIAAMHEEKRRTEGRIGGLLARFDEIGQ